MLNMMSKTVSYNNQNTADCKNHATSKWITKTTIPIWI